MLVVWGIGPVRVGGIVRAGIDFADNNVKGALRTADRPLRPPQRKRCLTSRAATWLRSRAPRTGKDAQGCKMRHLLHIVCGAWPRGLALGLGLKIMALGFVALSGGCAASRQSPCAVGSTPAAVYQPAPAAADLPGSAGLQQPVALLDEPAVAPQPTDPVLPPSGAPVIQAQYAALQGPFQPTAAAPPPALQGPFQPTAAAPPPERLPAVQAVPAGMSLDQAIGATLMADPKIRAGLEAIHQANADLLTNSLPPNPTLITDGAVPAVATVHARHAGRTLGVRRASGVSDRLVPLWQAGGGDGQRRLGVRQSEADYADLIRQRVTATATAFYDVLEGKVAAGPGPPGHRKPEPTGGGHPAGRGRRGPPAGRAEPRSFGPSQESARPARSGLGPGVAKAKLRAQFGRTDADPSFDVAGNLDAPVTAEPLPVEERLPWPSRTGRTFSPCELRFPRPRRTRWSSSERPIRRSRPNSATPGSIETPLGFPDADSWVRFAHRDRCPCSTATRATGRRPNRWRRKTATICKPGWSICGPRSRKWSRNFSTAYQNAKSVAQEQVRLAAEVRDSITKAYDVGRPPPDRRARRRAQLPRHLSALYFQPGRLLAGRLQVQLGDWQTSCPMTA